MAAVVDLPLVPVTPMIRAGQFSDKQFQFRHEASPPTAWQCGAKRLSGPNRRIDHDQVRPAGNLLHDGRPGGTAAIGDVGQQRPANRPASLHRPSR